MWKAETTERILLRKNAAWTAFCDPSILFAMVLVALPFVKSSAVVGTLASGLITALASGARPKYAKKLKSLTESGAHKIHDSLLSSGRRQVEMTLHLNGIVTGSDSGVLWEKNGVLFFEGVRSSFRLTKRLNNLKCKCFQKSCAISFVVEQDFVVEMTFNRFARGPVERWLKGPDSKAVKVLPPLTLAPEVASPKRYVHLQIAAISIAFLVLAFTRDLSGKAGTIELCIALAFASILAVLLTLDYRRGRLQKMIEARPWLARYSQDPVRDLVGVIGSLASSR